jgi:large subunit ribosomal protein L22
MELKEYNKENMAKVTGRSTPVSTKQAIVISDLLRGMNLQKAKSYLEEVIKKKKAVPFTRFNHGIGHKTGMGPGRYPLNSSKEILELLKSAESNAQFKGMNISNIIIAYMNASKAATAWHYGRQRRRQMKRTNITIILTEKQSKKTEEKKVETTKLPEKETKGLDKPKETKKEEKQTEAKVDKK